MQLENTWKGIGKCRKRVKGEKKRRTKGRRTFAEVDDYFSFSGSDEEEVQINNNLDRLSDNKSNAKSEKGKAKAKGRGRETPPPPVTKEGPPQVGIAKRKRLQLEIITYCISWLAFDQPLFD